MREQHICTINGYIVAKLGGKLVAYRWDGEQTLSRDKFIWVDREEA